MEEKKLTEVNIFFLQELRNKQSNGLGCFFIFIVFFFILLPLVFMGFDGKFDIMSLISLPFIFLAIFIGWASQSGDNNAVKEDIGYGLKKCGNLTIKEVKRVANDDGKNRYYVTFQQDTNICLTVQSELAEKLSKDDEIYIEMTKFYKAVLKFEVNGVENVTLISNNGGNFHLS